MTMLANDNASISPQHLSGCKHCGQPVLVTDATFCCAGCATVYDTIHDLGLEEFYRYRDASDRQAARNLTPQSYAHFDTPLVLEEVAPRSGNLRLATLFLEGVHCAGCIWLIERLPGIIPGVTSARLNFGTSVATIAFDPQRVALSAILDTLHSLGYPAHRPSLSLAKTLAARQSENLLRRIAVAAFSAGNVMILAVSLYEAEFTGIEPPYFHFLRWTSLVLFLPALLYSARPLFENSLAALRQRQLHLDLPLSFGILGAFILSTIHTVIGSGEIYFDSLATLILVILTGRWLQARAMDRARATHSQQWILLPDFAVRVGDDDTTERVPRESLGAGEVVVVGVGERVPADGKVTRGTSALDLSILTGEQDPIAATVGDTVEGGALNLTSPLTITLTNRARESRAERLINDAAEAKRTPLLLLSNRISGVFTLTVLIAATGTFLGWWLFVGMTPALNNTLALLVLACPCALGLAVPASMTVAVGQAARQGVFLRAPHVFEGIVDAKTIFFDKTGTLTTGELAITSFTGDSEVRDLLATAAHAAPRHPISRALASLGGNVLGVDSRYTPGGGVTLETNRGVVLVGSPSFCHYAIEDDSADSVVIVVRNGMLLGSLTLRDEVRAGLPDFIAELHQQGYETAILSGDRPAVVNRISKELGVSAGSGSLSPEEKRNRVVATHPSCFIGDGINDVGALSAATVAVSVRGGLATLLDGVDVYLNRGDAAQMKLLFDGARKTVNTMRFLIGYALLFNVVGGGLAIAGAMTPLTAAILMPASSLTVVAIAVLRRMW